MAQAQAQVRAQPPGTLTMDAAPSPGSSGSSNQQRLEGQKPYPPHPATTTTTTTAAAAVHSPTGQMRPTSSDPLPGMAAHPPPPYAQSSTAIPVTTAVQPSNYMRSAKRPTPDTPESSSPVASLSAQSLPSSEKRWRGSHNRPVNGLGGGKEPDWRPPTRHHITTSANIHPTRGSHHRDSKTTTHYAHAQPPTTRSAPNGTPPNPKGSRSDKISAEEKYFRRSVGLVLKDLESTVVNIERKLNPNHADLASSSLGKAALVALGTIASALHDLWQNQKEQLGRVKDILDAVGIDLDKELQDFQESVTTLRDMLGTTGYGELRFPLASERKGTGTVQVVPSVRLKNGTTIHGTQIELCSSSSKSQADST